MDCTEKSNSIELFILGLDLLVQDMMDCREI